MFYLNHHLESRFWKSDHAQILAQTTIPGNLIVKVVPSPDLLVN